MYGLNIIIGNSDIKERKNLRDILTRNGYHVAGEAADGYSAMKLIRSLQPDVAILDSQLNGQNVLDIARISAEDHLAPIILTTDYNRRNLLDKAKEGWVFGFIMKPFDEEQLVATVEITAVVYKKIAAKEKQVEDLKYQLQARKAIEKAKGLLMVRKGYSEEQAYKWMRDQSMEKRKSLETIALAVIKTYHAKVN
ncbi:MAG: ANTAR domain-containing protein [Bacillota bacterium]|nr:ANTAR domain-containing protein [Bacillota bacterium]